MNVHSNIVLRKTERSEFKNKWNGLIAELLENRADLTLTSLKVTTERNAAIDFSIPLMETGIGIIVSLRPGAISTTAFLSKRTSSLLLSSIWILLLNENRLRAVWLSYLGFNSLGYTSRCRYHRVCLRIFSKTINNEYSRTSDYLFSWMWIKSCVYFYLDILEWSRCENFLVLYFSTHPWTYTIGRKSKFE